MILLDCDAGAAWIDFAVWLIRLLHQPMLGAPLERLTQPGYTPEPRSTLGSNGSGPAVRCRDTIPPR